jgi:hypothetical protein
MTSKLSNPETTIFNIHVPPHNSHLDTAPLLGQDLEVKTAADLRWVFLAAQDLMDQINTGQVAPGATLVVSAKQGIAYAVLPPKDGLSHYRFLVKGRVPDVIVERNIATLEKLGIVTIGALAHFPKEFLTYHFGLNGDNMRNSALGDDDGEVVPYYKGVPVKSMGHEFTLSEDIDSREKIGAHLLRLSDQVARRMRQDGYMGRVIALKIRDSKFKTTIRQRAVPNLMNDEDLIYRTALALLEENWDGRQLRLLGVSVSSLVESGGAEQPSLFDDDEHKRKMTEAVDSLRNKFGDASLVRAGVLE